MYFTLTVHGLIDRYASALLAGCPKYRSLDPADVLKVITESIRSVADAQSQQDSNASHDPDSLLRRISLARQQHVLVTTAETLSSLSMDISAHLTLPSVSLIAAVAIDIISDLAGQCSLHAAGESDAQVVVSNAPALTDTSIPEVANLFTLLVAQAVGHGESPPTELEVMMTVKGLVKQQGISLFASTPVLAIPPQLIDSCADDRVTAEGIRL